MHCDANNAASNCLGATFRANTLAISTSSPVSVTDFASPYPAQLCNSPVNGYRLHLTNIVSLSSTTGVAWYANVSSDTTNDIDGAVVGSGVVTITYSGSGSPSCTVTSQFWGETEPIWGDHGVIGKNLDGYIYILGALGANAPGNNYSDVYVARVAPGSQAVLSAYQYWNGSTFTSTRLTYPNFQGWSPAAVMTGVFQGSITYNNYYNLYMYLAPGPALSGQITVRTAQVPTGPWTTPVVLFAGNTIYYAPVAQSHYDTTGRTLVFDASVFSPIYLQTIKVTFR
ncbi:hypothetical protein K461DRAFT_282559 [Myriangium duriaei CBS 260.36]|uniref:DUF4185 domain-containing protein n=1 Tax=Myriangium duriaei CBS 260.36 TaxID=1168546 RepID=A0A9P4IVA1_9PEZI|nr:hypothetical protein K461DRAFT_282559 [Myriangium duriaei CBS 260.36]